MQLEKGKGLLFPAHTGHRFGSIVWTSTQIWVKDSTAVDFAAQSAVQQWNPFYNEPEVLAPQKPFAPIKCFDLIVRRDISVQLPEIQWCAHKIFDKCSANHCLPILQMRSMSEKQLFFHIQFDGFATLFCHWTRQCHGHIKNILLLSCMEMFSWFKGIKNHVRIAISQSACCRWIVQHSCDSVHSVTHPCHRVGHASFLISHRVFKWNKRPLYSAPVSHKKH